MSISRAEAGSFSSQSALVVGVGGLGCPAALALVIAGVGRVVLADDDIVEETNLHRQILFEDGDVGRDKLDVAFRVLSARAPAGVQLEVIRTRLVPDNARELVRSVDVVLEGTDNYASKFLAADACHLERRPIVHGSAIRWRATVWAVPPEGRPCYRCLFEDLPEGTAQPGCAEAGVMGPVVGLAGALMGDRALRIIDGDRSTYGLLASYDGKLDRLREVPVPPRPGCALCGEHPGISDVRESRYMGQNCSVQQALPPEAPEAHAE